MSTKPLHPLSSHFHLQLAVCAGGRIRDSRRLLVDIGLRSQKACDALNFFDELVEHLDRLVLYSDSQYSEVKDAQDLLDRIRKCAYTE